MLRLARRETTLSGWVGVDCSNQIGSERLLVKLKGWREPSLNADNFVARLTATCRNDEAENILHYNVGFDGYVKDFQLLPRTRRMRWDCIAQLVPGGGL